jgi:hypothetical protein
LISLFRAKLVDELGREENLKLPLHETQALEPSRLFSDGDMNAAAESRLRTLGPPILVWHVSRDREAPMPFQCFHELVALARFNPRSFNRWDVDPDDVIAGMLIPTM